MECKNCGTENEEGWLFCKNCGKRLDGKITCPSCGVSVPDDCKFCPKCGANFIPSAPKSKRAVPSAVERRDDKAQSSDERNGGKVSALFSENKKIIEVISLVLIILCALCSFGFVFGMGCIANGSASLGIGSESAMLYDYFGSVYKEYNSALKSAYYYYDSAFKFVNVTGTVISAVGLLAVIISALVTVGALTAKYCFKWRLNVEKPALITYLCYVAFAISFYAYHYICVDGAGSSSSIALNGASLAGVIISTVLFGLYFIVKAVNNVAENFKTALKSTVAKYSLIVLACVVLGLLTYTVVCMNLTVSIESYYATAKQKMSVNTSFPLAAMLGAMSTLESTADVSALMNYSIVGVVFGLLIIISLTALIYNLNFGKYKIINISLSAATLIFTVLYFAYNVLTSGLLEKILPELIKNSLDISGVQIKANPDYGYSIAILVLTVLLVIASVIYKLKTDGEWWGGNGNKKLINPDTAESKALFEKTEKIFNVASTVTMLACALLSFIFAFCIGTVTELRGTRTGNSSSFFYDYFGKVYQKSAVSNYADRINNIINISGTVICAVGLLAVISAFAFTVWRAVRKFAFKKDADLVKPAALTFFSYVAFAVAYSSFSFGMYEYNGYLTDVSCGTYVIVGLSISAALFAAYIILRSVRRIVLGLNGKVICDFIFKLFSVALAGVVLGFLCTWLMNVWADGARTGLTVRANFAVYMKSLISEVGSTKLSSFAYDYLNPSTGGIICGALVVFSLALLIYSLIFCKKKFLALISTCLTTGTALGYLICAVIASEKGMDMIDEYYKYSGSLSTHVSHTLIITVGILFACLVFIVLLYWVISAIVPAYRRNKQVNNEG